MRTPPVDLLALRNQRLLNREMRRLRSAAGADGRISIASPNERKRQWLSDQPSPMPEPLTNGGQVVGSAQLLVMSATADPIASGGDYVTFGSVVAQVRFDDVSAAGSSWVHPISGVYVLTYEHAWDGYEGGGTVQLELDGAIAPEGTLAQGSAGSSGRGSIAYFAAAGAVGKVKVTQTSGSAQTCSGTVHIGVSDPAVAERTSTLLDSFFVDSRLHSQHASHGTYAESSIVLQLGVEYTVVVDGNYTRYADATLPLGSPDAIVYLSPSQSQRDALGDAETIYADHASFPGSFPRHTTSGLHMNLGSGWAHQEPTGGPFSAPQAGHSYTYSLTGEGSTLKLAITDSPISDNNGMLRVQIFSVAS